MNKKMRFIFPAIFMMVLLSACVPLRGMPAGTLSTMPDQVPPVSTDSVAPTSTQTISPTISNTMTNTATLTNTSLPNGYTLVDWREPAEVITPENMDRVEKIGQLKFADNLVRFAFSPDGSRFGASLIETATRNIYVLDPFTFGNGLEIRDSFGFVAFSYDGLILETNGIQYDSTTGNQISGGMTISAFPGATMDIEFSPNGQYIVTAGTDHLLIFPMKPGIERGTFGRYGEEACHVSVSPDSELLAVNYCYDYFTEIWDPYLMQPVKILKLKDINGNGKPRFSTDGKSLFFTGNGTWEGQKAIFFQEWDYHSGTPIHIQVVSGESSESETSMDISPVSQLAALGTMDGKIFLLPFRDCKAIQIGENNQSEDNIDIVAFRPDGKLLATVGPGGNTIDFWGIPSSGSVGGTIGPMESATVTPVSCPNIPMIVEHPTVASDWWGGGRARK